MRQIFIYHSCLPNFYKFAIGGFTFTIVPKHMAAGEKLTHSYWPGTLPLKEGNKKAWAYSFVCECPILELSMPRRKKSVGHYAFHQCSIKPDITLLNGLSNVNTL